MVSIALSLLAIKISIVLEINIDSSSSTDRGEGTKSSGRKFIQSGCAKKINRITITYASLAKLLSVCLWNCGCGFESCCSHLKNK